MCVVCTCTVPPIVSCLVPGPPRLAAAAADFLEVGCVPKPVTTVPYVAADYVVVAPRWCLRTRRAQQCVISGGLFSDMKDFCNVWCAATGKGALLRLH